MLEFWLLSLRYMTYLASQCSKTQLIHSLAFVCSGEEASEHLLNLSPECRELLDKADNIVEISVIEDLDWQHVADDRLA